MKKTTFQIALRKRKPDGTWPAWSEEPSYEERSCYTVLGSGLVVHGCSGSWDISHWEGYALDEPGLRDLPTLKVAEYRIKVLSGIIDWAKPMVDITGATVTVEQKQQIRDLCAQWRKEDRDARK